MRGTAYAVAEIVGWLLVAALIGVAIGWLLRSWFRSRRDNEELEAAEVNQKDQRKNLEAELDDWRAKAGSLSADLDHRQADVDRLNVWIGERDRRIAELETEISSHRSAMMRMEARVDDRESTIAALRTNIGKEDQQADSLRKEIDIAYDTIGTLRKEADGYKATIEALRRELDNGKQAEDETNTVQTVAGAPDANPTAAPSEKEVAVARVAEIATRTRAGGPRVDDDLKRIHGVGPKLEKLLKSLDITSFRQVANFTADDIHYVTAALDAFPGRIERDDWMSSAATEHMNKYNEPV